MGIRGGDRVRGEARRWRLGGALPAAGALLLVTSLAAGEARAAFVDGDGDGIADASDNCPGVPNIGQADCNHDGVGDACEASQANRDADSDGVCDGVDNCANLPNVGQMDCDGNGVGDACQGVNLDPDFDGVCAAADNCPAAANADQADCDHDGIGDACDTDKDADFDGVCDAADNCPGVSNTDQTDTDGNHVGNACELQAVTVPWIPSNPNIPHSSWSGRTTTLKGIARFGANQYMWDYGDGSAPMAWTAISNAYNLGVSHVYTGSVGQVFVATLSVRNSANPAKVATATYLVRLEDAGATLQATTHAQLDVRVNAAIDEGLWYLHTTMSRSTLAAAPPGYGQAYGFWSAGLAGSCAATDAFQLHGSKTTGDSTKDPYVEDVQRGLAYMLNQAQTPAIATQLNGRPDLLPNGVGVRFGSDDVYTAGICSVTFASSGAPNVTARNGGAKVYGRSYKDIVQDVVDWWSYAQQDNGTYRGGWHYSANDGSADGSTNQWPILGMTAAEANMASTVPAYVRSEAHFFLDYTHDGQLNQYNGGWGYQGPTDAYVNHVKTAAGMSGNYFLKRSMDNPLFASALGFLYRNWSLENYGSGGAWNIGLGNSYAMYGIMKAMRLPEPDITDIVEYDYAHGVQTANHFDWYYSTDAAREGLAVNLVRRQAANGSWSDQFGNNAQSGAFATGWDILILIKGVTTIPPQPLICDCANQTYDQNQDVTLSGACSTHPDANRHIVKYEWDFDYANSFDVDGSGQVVTKAGGYATYGTYPVALRVTDDNPDANGGPQTAIATCSVVIKPPPHCPHASAGGPYDGFVHTDLTFDASATFDPDGDPLSYEWDLDNDGLFGAADHDVFGMPSDGVGINPTLAYPAARIAPVAVRVTDHPSQNARPYDAQECTVTEFSTVNVGNHDPVANPGGPYSVLVNATIQLDGRGSSDIDGDALTYNWDLNNDGIFNDSSSPTPVFTAGATPAGNVLNVCLKVTDPSGASSSKCTTVTVIANRAPTCDAGGPTYGANTCVAGSFAIALAGGATDADNDPLTYTWTTTCPGGSFQNGNAPAARLQFAPGCAQNCQVTLTVSDGKTQTSCNAAVAATDEVAPTFLSTPEATTVECGADNAQAQADWLASFGGAVDACSAANVSQVSSTALGCGNTGTTTVTFTATDACDNAADAQSTFTVTDTTPPTFSVLPHDLTVESDGQGNAADFAAWQRSAVATDSCGDADVLPAEVTALTDGCGATGEATGTWTAVDACNNTHQAMAKFSIVDTTKPAFTATPADRTVECGVGNDADLQAWLAGAAASDVDGATVTNDFAALTPACGGTGSAHVKWTAADACGNSDGAEATFTIVDRTGPEFYLAPVDRQVECDPAANPAQLDTWLASVAAQDACGSQQTAVDNDFAALSDLCGATGAATVRFTTEDACGNPSAASATFTIADTTPPVIAAPAQDRTVECDGQGNAADLQAWLDSVSATDVCGAATVGHEFPGLSDGPGATGTGVATWTATDACGLQSAPTSARFTIVDTTKPVFTHLPQDKSVESDGHGNPADLQAWLADVAATDTCGDVSITNDFNGLSDGAGGTGSATVTWTATDANGQTTTVSATFRIVDTTPPTVTCPADAEVQLGADDCRASQTFTATSTDADGGAASLAHTFDFAQPGEQTFTYTFTDPSGNTASCTQRVTAVDVTPPVVTCAPTESINLGATTCQAAKTYTATARDACGGPKSLQHTFSFTKPGADSFTYTFADAAGNSASCTQTVTAVDVTPPVYTAGSMQLLWPPNHQYEAAVLSECGTFRDACGGAVDPDDAGATITRVTSDEAELSKGSGNTRDDMVIQSASAVGLRSEREGSGNGRVYTIHFTLTDAAGNASADQVCKVGVPHDQSPKGAPVEDAPVYTVNAQP